MTDWQSLQCNNNNNNNNIIIIIIIINNEKTIATKLSFTFIIE